MSINRTRCMDDILLWMSWHVSIISAWLFFFQLWFIVIPSPEALSCVCLARRLGIQTQTHWHWQAAFDWIRLQTWVLLFRSIDRAYVCASTTYVMYLCLHVVYVGTKPVILEKKKRSSWPLRVLFFSYKNLPDLVESAGGVCLSFSGCIVLLILSQL